MANITTIEHYTNYWIKAKGLNKRVLETHPYIDDLILMLRVKDELWTMFNTSEQAIWQRYWHNVYINHRPLHSKALKKLEQITITSTNRQTKVAAQRQKIKAIRQNNIHKLADNMTAKDVRPSQTVPWE